MAGEHILKLLDEPNLRLTMGDKWLIRYEGHEGKKVFEVYQKRVYRKNARVLVKTEDEELACKILKGE